jgi:hypothetical protein
MSISLGIDVGAVSVKLAALSSREDCALLARVAEASPASRGGFECNRLVTSIEDGDHLC